MSQPPQTLDTTLQQVLGPYRLQSALQYRPMFVAYAAALDDEHGAREPRVLKVSHGGEQAAESARYLELEAELLNRVPDSGTLAGPVRVEHHAGHTILDFGPVDGVTLAHLLRARRTRDVRLTSVEAIQIIRQALDAIAAVPVIELSNGDTATGLLCHGWGDSTFLVTKDGALTALGFSDIIVNGKRPSNWSWTALTAPEYCQPGPPIGTTADIYGAGALLFSLLTLHPVISASNLDSLVLCRLFRSLHPVPSDVFEDLAMLDGVVDRALRCDPLERYQTVADFAGAIAAAVGTAWTTPDASLGGLYKEAKGLGITSIAVAPPESDQHTIGARVTELV